VVADNNGAGLFAGGELPQAGGIDRAGHGGQHQTVLRIGGFELSHAGFQNFRPAEVRVQRHPGFAKGNDDRHEDTPVFSLFSAQASFEKSTNRSVSAKIVRGAENARNPERIPAIFPSFGMILS
jgi:hypothetical protein